MDDMEKMEISLRTGDWVEVKSALEILESLDGDGTLDGLPFMPEMMDYCGRQFPRAPAGGEDLHRVQVPVTGSKSS